VAGHIQDNASGSYRTAGTCKEPTVASYGDRDELRQHNEQQQRYTQAGRAIATTKRRGAR